MLKVFQGIYYQTSFITELTKCTLFEAEPLVLILQVLILFLKFNYRMKSSEEKGV